jgi:outer membrane protein assembly factor BamB
MKRSLTSVLSVVLAVPLTVGLLATPAAAEKSLTDIPLPNGFSPEGIAIHEGVAYTGSLVDGSILRVDLAGGDVEEFAPSPGPDKRALGMDVDRFDRLWVAGGGEAFFPGVAPSFRVYDTDTGELLADVEVAGEFLNDVFVTKEAAWFTDSFAAQLFRVPIAKDGEIGTPERVELGGAWEPSGDVDANGITAAPGGKLIVGQTVAADGSGGALYVIDADAEGVADAQRITISGGSLEAGTDGLVLVGRKLYVVNPDGVVKIRLNRSLTTGTVVTTLDVGAEWATTAKKFRGSLYVVDGNFGENFANIGNPDAEFNIVKVPFGRFHD